MAKILGLFLINIILFVVQGSKQSSKLQRVAVSGVLTCDGKGYKGATVKLYDSNVIVDSPMAKNETAEDGSFTLDGTSRDWLSDIDPILYIYHKCNRGKLQCKRETIFTIPSDYIFDQKDQKARPVPFGTYELMLVPKAETTKCLPALVA